MGEVLDLQTAQQTHTHTHLKDTWENPLFSPPSPPPPLPLETCTTLHTLSIDQSIEKNVASSSFQPVC